MKNLIVTGSIFAALSVLFGAFGAHGLKTRLSFEYLAIFETAVRYQMYHALGLMLMGISGFHLPNTFNLPSIIFFDLWDSDFFRHSYNFSFN